MTITIVPTGKPVGAVLHGIDLAAGVDDAAVRQIKDALDRHAMLCIRGQDLTPRQQVDFTARLGPLQGFKPGAPFRLVETPDVMIISNIEENGAPMGVVEAGHYWHSDASYAPRPPAYACLHAKEIPLDAEGTPLGGTMFVSTAYAYDTLPEAIKTRIEGLRVLHSRDHRRFSATRAKSKNEYDAPGQELDQPVVRTHPVTGRKCLYVNQTYSVKLLGVSDEESNELLGYLIDHIIREAARYTHRWAVGDLVLWDDCAVQHHALGDYALPQRRLVHRTVVDGTRPV